MAMLAGPRIGLCQGPLAFCNHRIHGLWRGAPGHYPCRDGSPRIQGSAKGGGRDLDPMAQYLHRGRRQLIQRELIQTTARQMPTHEMADQPVRLAEIETAL
jgi:hypothetical protein